MDENLPSTKDPARGREIDSGPRETANGNEPTAETEKRIRARGAMTKKPYYYHSETKEMRWDKPSHLAGIPKESPVGSGLHSLDDATSAESPGDVRTALSEGSREIEAAKQWLAAAQTRAKAASAAMANARAMMIAAERNVTGSRKEVEEAREFLREAEERRDAIGVDSTDDGSGKRRGGPSAAAKQFVPAEGSGVPEVVGAYERVDDQSHAKRGRWDVESLFTFTESDDS